MKKFIHTSVRLNTDLGRATGFFTHPGQLSRWLCDHAEEAVDNSGLMLAGIKTPEDFWHWDFEEIQREKKVTVAFNDIFSTEESLSFTLEIQLMKCTSTTEYCSEIHLMQHGFEDSETGDDLRRTYEGLWTEKLEKLRALVNGKWIIEDRDLSLDIFR